MQKVPILSFKSEKFIKSGLIQTISPVPEGGTLPNNLFTSTIGNGALTSDNSIEGVPPVTVQESSMS
jgi:hypothetical protein